MGPRIGLNGCEKFRHHRDSISDSQPVASRYTDYDIPAQIHVSTVYNITVILYFIVWCTLFTIVNVCFLLYYYYYYYYYYHHHYHYHYHYTFVMVKMTSQKTSPLLMLPEHVTMLKTL